MNQTFMECGVPVHWVNSQPVRIVREGASVPCPGLSLACLITCSKLRCFHNLEENLHRMNVMGGREGELLGTRKVWSMGPETQICLKYTYANLYV